MSQYLPTGSSQPITIFYEVIPVDTREADPGELQAVADTVTEALRKDGYTVNPVPTGARGFDFLFQILPFIQASAQVITTHRDEIATALKSIQPVIERIETSRKERAAKSVELQTLGSIECEIRLGDDYDSFKFKSTDHIGTEQFATALEKFLERSEHVKAQTQPRIVDSQKPTLTIREHVPSRPRRRKR